VATTKTSSTAGIRSEGNFVAYFGAADGPPIAVRNITKPPPARFVLARGSFEFMVFGFSSSCNTAESDVTDTPDVFPRRNRNGKRIFEQGTLPGSYLRGLSMGLDLALGVVILIAAFRGWFQGFVGQAVRLTSLVIAVYGAVRVRDYGKPYVIAYLTKIQPDVIDRLLWWVSFILTYLLLVAVSMLVVKMTRRPAIPGIPQSDRNDQFAGFFLGAAKGLLIAAFLAAGIQNYGREHAKNVSWAEDQAKASWALKWDETYQPARKIWASQPVQHFRNHIYRMGIDKPHKSGDPLETGGDGTEAENPLRTASRPTEAESTRSDGHSADHATPSGSSTSSPTPPAEAPPSSTE
jgi:uncharacterized membrane protein required for colicin V production